MFGMILAAGRGQRLMPLTENTPKPLIKINNIALIEYAINALKSANITNIVINVSYLGKQIISYLGEGRHWGVTITYSIEKTALETAGGIIKALPMLDKKPFVVINSDVLCDYDLSMLALPDNMLAHLVLVDNPEHNPKGDFLHNHKIFTFSGIGIYHPDLFKPYLTQTKLALAPVLKAAIHKGEVSTEHYPGSWQDIGTPERLKLINNDAD